MKVTKEDVKAILLDAYHNGYIEPNEDSEWGFNYTEANKETQWLISDGLYSMFKVPLLAFHYVNIINEAGKELYKEIIH